MLDKFWHVPSSSSFIVAMAAESVSAAAQSVTVAFDAGDAISEELGS